MPTATTLKRLDAHDAFDAVKQGAALVDLRSVDDYLDVHVPGSLSLMYEAGPGLASRARDCLPLDLPLALLDLGAGDVGQTAAALRGKGFAVLGALPDGINEWARLHGAPRSTELVQGNRRSKTAGDEPFVLDVGDPGAGIVSSSIKIPIEKLWGRIDEVPKDRVVIASGYGVRAALAVGMLERAGVDDIVFWKP